MEIIPALLPHLTGLRVEAVVVRGITVRIDAATQTVRASCGVCGAWSTTVHGRYVRRLGDVRLGSHEVLVALTVRRFACVNAECRRQTFVEQVPGLTRRHARHTVLATGDLQAVAAALGGRPGSRLAQRLAVSVSRSTLIRMIRRMPDPSPVTPTVLGVDDFARRRGHRYATVLIDMHTRRPIDVLPDRTADTLAAWLRDHPGVQIICRDRGGSYAEGARKGAPDAIQVADRWHLLKNLSDTVEKVIRGHRRCLRTHTEPTSALVAPADESVRTGRRAANTRQRHAAVHALRAEGLSISATARRLDMNVRTARKYAHAATAEALIGPNAASRPSVLAPFHPYLRQRLTDGVHQTAVLHAEIVARGYRGSLRVLRDWLAISRTRPTPATAVRVPSARRITAWIMRPGHKLTDDDRADLADARRRCPDLDTVAGLARGFAALVRHQGTGQHLDAWINRARHAGYPEIRGFAAGLASDRDAVVAGLTQPWSSGPVEGQVNRIKTIKRQMYGRANLDLLRKRVLTTP
ncbi:ISL3 family transposase [Verrucosispora sp. WMMD1129]|uniref:ISL3 family transposase n=1 Tax=Verrucosispora sp. WMMD1129 TaxID=3016093 RepID=UPI00249CC191|nr:ISL3 family transposase [Verrucosispora sp. WMMD1129]WFE47734.1 ISL3 family transposase [Verrucosispora sp. WMMD1129]